jgi:hypothetical protein
VTIPAVRVPGDAGVRMPVDFTLKSGWRFDAKRRAFHSDRGETFSPRGKLPDGSRLVYKVPGLAKADPATLTAHERDLRRYMQLILPEGESPAAYLRAVRAWPPVEAAHVGPDVSLPRQK